METKEKRLVKLLDDPLLFTVKAFPNHGQTWGCWRLSAHNWTLKHRNAPWYEIDLEEMTSSAQMLDVIFQVSNKTWCSKDDTGDFIEALRVVLDPQANICSWGVNKKFNPTRYLKCKGKYLSET